MLLGRDVLWLWVTRVSGCGGGTGAGLPMCFLTITSFKAFCCCPSSLFAFHSAMNYNYRIIEETKGLKQPLSSDGKGQKETKTHQEMQYLITGEAESLPDQPQPPPAWVSSTLQQRCRQGRQGLHGSALMKAPATSVKADTPCLPCPCHSGSQGPGLLQELWKTASGFTAGKNTRDQVYRGTS